MVPRNSCLLQEEGAFLAEILISPDTSGWVSGGALSLVRGPAGPLMRDWDAGPGMYCEYLFLISRKGVVLHYYGGLE